MMTTGKTIFTAILAALIIALPSQLLAQDQALTIKYRQSIMKAIGGHMGALGTNAKGKLGHGSDAAFHAASLRSLLGMIPDAFKTKTDGGKTRAKAKIWDDWAGYEKAAMNAEKAAADLVAALNAGGSENYGAKLKAVGKGCGGCHKKYRAKKS